MTFSKITREQSDAAALRAEFELRVKSAEAQEEAIQKARREHSRAVYELGPPADPDVDRKSLADANLRVSQIEAEIALGETALEAGQAAILNAEAAQALLADDATELDAEVVSCDAELRAHEESAGPVRKLTDKERQWLAAFASVSPDPPSQSMYLMLELEKAEAKAAAGRKRVEDQGLVVADLRSKLDLERQKQEDRAKELAAVKLRIEQIKARGPGHRTVIKLKTKLDALLLTQSDGGSGEKSLRETMVPFRQLIAEIDTTLSQIQSGGGLIGDSGTKIAEFQNKASTLVGVVSRLEGVTGDEALRSITHLPELATTLNQLADAVTQLETVDLPKARKDTLKETTSTALTQFASTLPYGAQYLPNQLIYLARDIEKLDGLDWNGCEAAANLSLDARQKRLQTLSDAEDLRVKTEVGKTALYDVVEIKLKEEFEAGRLTKKKYNPIKEGVRSEKIDLPTFEQMLAEAKTEYEAALKLKKENDDGEFYTPTQWREKLGLTGSKTDWGMIYNEDGTHKGTKWNLHFSISNDSISPSTSWIKMCGNDTDTVYKNLFIDNVERKFRMHATFQMAGTGADGNVHLYLGDNTFYRENLIPKEIKADIKNKMTAMRTKYINDMKAAISPLILPKKDDADAD